MWIFRSEITQFHKPRNTSFPITCGAMDFDDRANLDHERHGPVWQKLPRPLQQLLWHSGWDSAVVLEAAFDDFRGALQLVENLDDNCEVAATNKAWAEDLLNWQVSVASEIRRQRRRLADPGLEHKALALQTFQRQRDQPPVASVLKVAQAYFLETHWRTRRARKTSLAVTTEGRWAVEAAEKDRWTLKIVGVLREAGTPVCGQAALASDPEAALMSVVGRRRSRTLRSRYKTWVKVRVWLNCVFNRSWPAHLGDMLDYLQDLALGPLAKTTPAGVGGALSFFESISGYPESQWISLMPLWKSNLGNLEMRLQSRGGETAVHKAPMFTVTMVIALELYVVSTRPKYKRFLGFCLLLKLWMTLRFDDLQGLSRSRLQNTSSCLKGVLTRTKTTGPGKRILEVPCYLHSQASFSGAKWLIEGFAILQEPAFNFERDYFVPVPSEDWEGTKPRILDYSYAAGLFRRVLSELPRPKRIGLGTWTESCQQMLPPPVPLFFSLHGPRHFVPSVGAALGIHKDERDMAGRWGIAAKQSGEYVLTARNVVLKVQATILREISGPDAGRELAYDEDDIMTELWTWLKNRDENLDRDEMVKLLAVYPDNVQNCCLRQVWPANPEAVIVPEEEMADVLVYPSSEQKDAEAAPTSEEIYWQSVSKKGFRRLHKVDGCGSYRLVCANWQYLTQKQALTVKSDKPCLLCWPELSKTEGPVSSDSGSPSESSSSDQESPAEAEVTESQGEIHEEAPAAEEEDLIEVIP